LTKERVAYAYAALWTANLKPVLARHLGVPVGYGALIDSVTADGPAARAGLRGGSREAGSRRAIAVSPTARVSR
jgi:S1-C subfamily serine protease